jgi:hypothetical protein
LHNFNPYVSSANHFGTKKLKRKGKPFMAFESELQGLNEKLSHLCEKGLTGW